MNWNYPTNIWFGAGKIEDLAEACFDLKIKSPLFVTDKGGASGTRTLPINVYEQGFSIGDIGMGSAVSMVIVLLLLFFMLIYFKLIGKRANES